MADGGDSGAGGNGSIWWYANHYKDGKKKPLKAGASGPGGKPSVDEVRLTDQALGHDGTSVSKAGDRLGHPGKFLVTLRFRTREEAAEAGQWVLDNVRPGEGGWLLSVLVPAIDRSSPDDDPPFEVKVEW